LAAAACKKRCLAHAPVVPASDEYRVNLIDLYYAVLLYRIADPGGFNGWFNSGADASTMRPGFDDSAEFFSNG
jgi:hypothetical protein